MSALFCGILLILGAGGLGVGVLSAQETFRFQHHPGDQYRIVSVVNESVFINGQFSHESEILNRIAVEVLSEETDGSGRLRVVYQTSEKGGAGGEGSAVFQWASEDTSVFLRNPRGLYTVPPGTAVPSIRHIPTFPEEALSPGDTWQAPAEEVHDLEPSFGIETILSLPVEVSYAYRGLRSREGEEYPLIEMEYLLVQEPDVGPGFQGQLYPERIEGRFKQRIWWDMRRGRPAFAEEEFVYAYQLSSGDVYQFQGSSQGHMEVSREMEKQNLAEEIQKDLDEQGVEGARAEAREDGIRITLEDLLFRPDTAELLPGEEEKLRRIAGVLAKHPDRDIRITGHAARVGSEEYLQDLSERRAAEIGRYLLSRGIRDASQIVIQGKGSSEPVADNATEEGRRRNRRVEINILEN